MPITNKMRWKYPAENQPSWFHIFESLMNQIDDDVYSSKENFYLILEGGGVISLDPGSDTLSWSEDLYVLSTLTGGIITIPAESLPGFEDGKVAYVSVSRPINGAREATVQVGDQITESNQFFIALRRGSQVIMRRADVTEIMENISPVDGGGAPIGLSDVPVLWSPDPFEGTVYVAGVTVKFDGEPSAPGEDLRVRLKSSLGSEFDVVLASSVPFLLTGEYATNFYFPLGRSFAEGDTIEISFPNSEANTLYISIAVISTVSQ